MHFIAHSKNGCGSAEDEFTYNTEDSNTKHVSRTSSWNVLSDSDDENSGLMR